MSKGRTRSRGTAFVISAAPSTSMGSKTAMIAFFAPPPTRPRRNREGPHVSKWLL
jgi:hypothetical protein